MPSPGKEHLPRLDRKFYQSDAYVHWVMTIDNRQVGWLSPIFYYKFRELLTHVVFRYSLACPIFCLMPDHIHMLWIGLSEKSDQINAMKYFRKHVGDVLNKLGFEFQHQPYDHVLREDERQEHAVEQLVEYIARNPERQKLVPIDGYSSYKYTSCLVPGYPEMCLWDSDYWTRFWRCCSFLRKNGLIRFFDEEIA
jgi:REP element-mobilizing transposase RayT